MAKIAKMQEVAVNELKLYEMNAKRHDIDGIVESMREFGFVSPVLIDKQYNVIAGHGRIEAAKQLGMESVPCVFVEGLTEEQRRAYILVDNKLTELGGWDNALVEFELDGITDIDMSAFGFDRLDSWFSSGDKGEARDGEEEYAEFLEKFEEKHTTDDCYTPTNIYDVVAEWVEKEYGVKRKNFVRPFYPGGDYQNEKYKDTDIVVDNPPFSILAEIVRFYIEHGIRFFMFAPNTTLFNYKECTAVCAGAGITYENGACVLTSFLTNLENGIQARTAPDLYAAITAADKENLKEIRKSFPKLEYPVHVVTAAMLSKLSKYGQNFKIKKGECALIRKLDAQTDREIFGGGYLLSDKAAADKAAADKYELSPRELAIVKSLG